MLITEIKLFNAQCNVTIVTAFEFNPAENKARIQINNLREVQEAIGEQELGNHFICQATHLTGHCVTNEGISITFFDCSITWAWRHDDSLGLLINQTYIGGHIESIGTALIDCMSIVFKAEQSAYIHRDYIGKTYKLDQGFSVDSQFVSHFQSGFEYQLNLISSFPQCIEDFFTTIFDLQEMVFLAAGIFDELKAVTCYSANDSFQYINYNKYVYSNVPPNSVLRGQICDVRQLWCPHAMTRYREIKKTGKVTNKSGILIKYMILTRHKDIPGELKLNLIIQCIEGYTGKFFKKEIKQYKRTNGLVKGTGIGLNDRLNYFLNSSPVIEMIFRDDIQNTEYALIVSKLAETRNYLSHLYDRNENEVIMGHPSYIYYYKLYTALCCTILEQLGAAINISNLKDMLEGIPG